MRKNLARLEAQCAALPADDPRRARNDAALARMKAELPALPKKRGPRVDHEDLEKHTQSAVGEYLSKHPLVFIAIRQNTGGMDYMGGDGKTHSMWFYHVIRAPAEITLTDFWGILKNGRPFAIECKRPSWRWAGNAREIKQLAYIDSVKSVGGVAGFARTLAEAIALLQ